MPEPQREQPGFVPSSAGRYRALRLLMEPVAVAGARLRAGIPAQARRRAPEPALKPPQVVKEVGKQVRCAAFYLRCYCLYGGCGPSAC